MDIRHLYALAISIVPILLFAGSSQIDAQEQFENYTDPSGSFTIAYPGGWEVSTSEDILDLSESDTDEIDFTLRDKVTNKVAAGVNVRIEKTPDQITNLEDLRTYHMTRLLHSPNLPVSPIVQEARIINTSDTSLSGKDAFSIRFQSPEIQFDLGDPSIGPIHFPSQEKLTITSFEPTNKKAYSVGFTADIAFYNLYYPIFQQMTESFEIIG